MTARRRQCVACGEVFTGDHRRCPSCQRTSRTCEGCARVFTGVERRCPTCRATERRCEGCGEVFTGNHRRCPSCWRTSRTCEGCARVFTGHTRRCPSCSATERRCEGCGEVFTGNHRRCPSCQRTSRTCEGCARVFTGTKRRCPSCRRTSRTCEGCARVFTGTHRRCPVCVMALLPPDVRQAIGRARNNARRARRRAVEVAGPVPPEVYAAIRAEGPCVYCGAPAEHVDHVRPLASGGWEHPDNLVPACAWCNGSKHDRLLTEWRPELVEHGALTSWKVAAELGRLVELEVSV